MNMTDQIKLDVRKIAVRAREIALETAKQDAGTAVGGIEGWMSAVLTHLAVREAISENMPMSEIFREIMRSKEDQPPPANPPNA